MLYRCESPRTNKTKQLSATANKTLSLANSDSESRNLESSCQANVARHNVEFVHDLRSAFEDLCIPLKAKIASNISGCNCRMQNRQDAFQDTTIRQTKTTINESLTPTSISYHVWDNNIEHRIRNQLHQSQYELKQTSASFGSKIIASRYDRNHRQPTRYQDLFTSQNRFRQTAWISPSCGQE